MITSWIGKALNKLTLDEFQRAVDKCEQLYHSGMKIVAVNRDESNRPRITVQIDSGEQKLLVL